ncbi:MAG: CarD family transcriptional regulator [Christensenellales bacterium]
MLNTILDRISRHPTFRLATDQFYSGGRIALFDMVPTQRLAFTITLSQQTPVIYLLPNERAARQAYQDAVGLGAEAIFIPLPELRFIRAVASREADWQRLRALDQIANGEARLIICSVETLQLHLPCREWFEQATLTFFPGQSYETSALALELAQKGYERVDLVEGKGQFALRGDILDVFPPQTDFPARIEFFDVQIDNIRAFDPLTQRSAQTLPKLRICPANEYLIPPNERRLAALRLEQALAQYPVETGMLPAWESQYVTPDLEQLMRDGTIDNAMLWTHLLYDESASLLSWLPGAGVVLDTPDRVSQRLEDAEKAHIELFAAALEANQAHPAQSGLLRTHEAVISLLKKRPLLLLTELLHGMGGLAPEHSHPFPGLRVDNYRGRLQALSSDIAAWQEQGFAIALFTGGQSRSERLAAALAAQGISAAVSETDDLTVAGSITLLSGSFSEGFLDTGAKLAVIAPRELFGSSRTKARKARTVGQRIEAFTDLSIGDYVVHDHHGIGIYQGTVRLQSEGIWRDYLFIQYRGSDKLYVPADQFDRVQKYIGSPDTAPPLNDLSSNTWNKQKSKVKAGLKQLAFDLVKLYAARQAIPGYAFEPFDPFEGQFADQFDYELTPDQEQAINEVLGDMAQPRNMDRLLCGDVGYGKTEVAMRAAFRAVMNGKQVAFLSPYNNPGTTACTHFDQAF